MKMRRKKNVPEATYTIAEAKLIETLLRSEDMMQLVRPILTLIMLHKNNWCPKKIYNAINSLKLPDTRYKTTRRERQMTLSSLFLSPHSLLVCIDISHGFGLSFWNPA